MPRRDDELPDVTEEQLLAAVVRGKLDLEAETVARRKEVRLAREAAAKRYARENASRRARARRLIQLGAEVEASGLADRLNHDHHALFGLFVTFLKNADEEKTEIPVEKLAGVGRYHREAVEAAPKLPPPPDRKPRRLPAGRVAIRFPSPPPETFRTLLRSRGYRWRLGLRAWVGSAEFTPDELELLREFGGQIGDGPDKD